MNLSQKMMIVPAGRVPFEISTLSELDKAMSSVLNNQKLSNLQKINLYSKILNKNLIMEERLNSKNVDTQSVPKPENIINEAVAIQLFIYCARILLDSIEIKDVLFLLL